MIMDKIREVVEYVIALVILMTGLDLANYLFIKNEFAEFATYLRLYFIVVMSLILILMLIVLKTRRFENE